MQNIRQKIYSFILLIILTANVFTAQSKTFTPDNENIHYTGRIDFTNPQQPLISGSAAYFELKFKGTDCELLLEDEGMGDNYNYMSIVLDGKYLGRIKITKEIHLYTITENLTDDEHTLMVSKATEAQIGYVAFKGIVCQELLPFKKNITRQIEFIGNSITCGMGLDTSEVPCGTGKWFDEHNAYLAYGPLSARALNADWLLSSYSGIGMARFWNAEEPIMPDVYHNTFLKPDSITLWNAESYIPDLISICLGQNDFSDGDDSYNRTELDSAAYVNNYIAFVKMLRDRYPNATVCMLTSPMQEGIKDLKLKSYLKTVKEFLETNENQNKLFIYAFPQMYVNGCSWHPNKEEHEKMAEGLIPFYKKVMGW